MNASVSVLEWPCYAPNITLDGLYTDQANPFLVLTEDEFTVAATFDVSCMKMDVFSAQWELLDHASTALTTLTNATEIHVPADSLLAGDYSIRITATLTDSTSYFDLSDKTVVEYAYVNVIDDLVLSGSDTILTPPGSGIWQVTTGKTMESITCV